MENEYYFKERASILDIPVIDGFQVIQDDNPQTILLAKNDNFIEQFTSDGSINDDTLDTRIEKVINNTKKFLTSLNCEGVNDSFKYYKDYSTSLFNFKLYFQDMVVNINNEKRIIRNIYSYFIEPKTNDFYQISVAFGPFILSDNLIEPFNYDTENNEVSKTLIYLITLIMDNLKYIEK